MEALLNSSSSVCFTLNAPKMAITTGSLLRDPNLYMKAANGYSSLSLSAPFTTHKLSIGCRDSVIVGAKNRKNKKADGHSFVPKPDEATGPFPEAVLLKEKKVQDGKLLPEFADEEEEKFYETLMLQLESETVVEQMRHYEVVYLIHEKHAEEVGNVNEKVQDFLREKKGKIWRLSDWGMRRLAYKINKAKNAHYILMNFELEAKWINDFKSMLDKDERVIRHLVIKRDEAITEDCPPPPEFHTLRAGTDDYDEEEEDIDYDDAYDYEDDKEDWDGEGEDGAMEDYDDEIEDGIIAVKNEAGDRELKNNISAIARNKGSKNLRSEKVDCDSSVPESDVDLLEFPLNLEFLEAEFFLYGSLGYGLDIVAPNLTKGGPPPIGARRAKLDTFTRDVIKQFALQEVGHLRAIQNKVHGFPRPLLDLSAASFAKVVNSAFGRPLIPPFDPYASAINYLLASYLIPYVGLTGYVGANPKLQGATSKRLVAGLLGVESGQDAVIRALLYERATMKVAPYGITVAEFTNRFSELRNKLGHEGLKDEGLVVAPGKGAEGKSIGNVLAGNRDSLAYDRTPEEILRIVYGGGDEHVPGGFYPKGANGRIARSHLQA